MICICIFLIFVLFISVNGIVNIPKVMPIWKNNNNNNRINVKTEDNDKYDLLDIGPGGDTDNNKKKKNKKVLILMSDTGGGHRASAQALDRAMHELFPHSNIDVDILDIWTDHATWPFNGFVETYRFLAKHPMLWRISYTYARFPPTRIATEIVSKFTCHDRFEKAMSNSNPDLVVSVHPLCQHIPIPIVKKMNENRDPNLPPIPFVTVVTDLGGAHETWFDKDADICFVPSKQVKKIALRSGIDRKKIIQHGLPVRPAFWLPPKSKKSLRSMLNLKQKINTVLLMGGGDGVGGLGNIALETASLLGKSTKPSQMVVICGHNKHLSRKLSSDTTWPSKVNVAVKGFCNNIDEYMGASDLIVTKAGPGTIAEAMIRGLPIVLSSFLPGQEKGNVPFVVDGGFGVYSGNRPKLIAKHVNEIFSSHEKMYKMSELAKSSSTPHATKDIAYDLARIVLRKDKELPELKSKKVN